MWPRLSIVAGLFAGVAVAALVLGGLLFLSPGPTVVFTPAPSATPVPSSSPAVGSPTASPSAPGASGSPSAPAALIPIGEAAPTLVVPRVGGGTIDLANLKGQPVWVNFMDTDCPPCQDEFPLMNGFATNYGDDGLVILAIDVKEDEATVAAFANELDATFPIGLDSDGAAATAWGAAAAMPVHFWIDTDGIVRDRALGGIGSDVMARGVATILPDVEVTP